MAVIALVYPGAVTESGLSACFNFYLAAMPVLQFRQFHVPMMHAMAAAMDPLVDEAQAAFLQRGVSISAASCGAQPFPSLCRVLACRVAPDRRQLTVMVSKTQAAMLLTDVQYGGRLALVCSQPSTHRTIQIKGEDAQLVAPDADDLQAVAVHRDAFVAEIAPLGFAEPLIRLLLTCAEQDIAAIRFTPNAAFDQTPGPRAGAALQANA
jgi:hypothetical protein